MPLTHPELVVRAATWLRNHDCKVVFTEVLTYSGESPDAIGWRDNGRSLLIECKASRSDFLADNNKEFRRNPLIALGSERYYLAPPKTIGVNELPPEWGLLETYGRGIRVIKCCPPRKDQRSDLAIKYEMIFLIAALNRVQVRVMPVTIDTWLKYENKTVSDPSILPKDEGLEEASRAAYLGMTKVTDPAELPLHEGTDDPMCPVHDMEFEKCSCVGPNDPSYQYQYIGNSLYAKPLVARPS